jgi:hypothetical protein
MLEKRKRGPHKGDGGRPRGTLRDDFPDNMIVAVVYWLSKGGKRASVPFLEMLIYLFDNGDFVITPDDGVGSVTKRDGVPVVMISALKNIKPKRDPGGKNYNNGGPRRQTPDGRTSMKRRVQFIRDKIKKHKPRLPTNWNPKGFAVYVRPPVLTKDQAWLGKCWMGLDCLLAGQKEQAMIAFGDAGWPLTGKEIERLNQFLNLTVVNIAL